MEQLNFKFFHSQQTFKFILKIVLILGHLFFNCGVSSSFIRGLDVY